jgi:hypothetical protein
MDRASVRAQHLSLLSVLSVRGCIGVLLCGADWERGGGMGMPAETSPLPRFVGI